jgi:trimethylguanosine synthase
MIANHIAAAAPAEKTVMIDAFCGSGGNTIAFALSGRWERVFAIEKDPEELKCAKRNAEIYGVKKKIFFILGDCLDVVKKRFARTGHEAVLFASPPWGGSRFASCEMVVQAQLTLRRPNLHGRSNI